MTRRLSLAVLLLTAGLATAPAVFADLGIDIAGFAFDPDPMTIQVGQTVGWQNSDGVNHTATADDGSFDTSTIAPGASSAGVTFNTAGTFAYHCKIHAAMHGTIVVTSATAPQTDTLPLVALPLSDPAPWGLLALAAVGGLVIGRRRFARPVEARAKTEIAPSNNTPCDDVA